jgi:reactive chlorine resistance protein C
MVYGGHFYLVWDTEIHTLRCRGHSALDREQPIYTVVGRIRAEGRSQDHGTIELTTAAVLTVGAVIPMASAAGAAMACVTFLLTTSFVFTTSGITQKSSTGFPVVSTLVEQFLLKDIALLAASFTLLLASLSP